jgi:hypothetical protein
MGNDAPPNIDWGRLFAEAVLLAENLQLPDPEGLAQDGITMLFEGRTPPWDASGETTLAEQVVLAAREERNNRERTERKRRHPKMVSKLVQAFDQRGPTPEELVGQQEEQATKLERLRADLADDPDGRAIVACEEQWIHTPAEQVARLGWPIERVRNARKRVARRVAALAGTDGEGEDEEDP